MSLGARIEQRRQAVGISQAELARRVGVRQSTLNSLIRGDSRTSRSLLKIARELQTTAAFLTGETDDPAGEGPQLSSASNEMLGLFERLAPADQKALLQLARSLSKCMANQTHNPGQGAALHDQGKEFRGE